LFKNLALSHYSLEGDVAIIKPAGSGNLTRETQKGRATWGSDSIE
jgi:hypothetical protein